MGGCFGSDAKGVEQVDVVGVGDGITVGSGEDVGGGLSDQDLLLIGEEARAFDDAGVLRAEIGDDLDEVIAVVPVQVDIKAGVHSGDHQVIVSSEIGDAIGFCGVGSEVAEAGAAAGVGITRYSSQLCSVYSKWESAN